MAHVSQKSAADLSLLTYGLWVIIPAVNITHVYLRSDRYLTVALGIGWLAALMAFVEAVYYRSVRARKL